MIVVAIIITSNNWRLWSVSDSDHSALCKFHVTDSQNAHDQITSDGRSKLAWSNCILCIPFILSASPNECCRSWLHTCDAFIITTWRLGLRPPLAARNNNNNIIITIIIIIIIIILCPYQEIRWYHIIICVPGGWFETWGDHKEAWH